jgi:hypothetical protein
MDMRFEWGKSYLWLFPVFLVLLFLAVGISTAVFDNGSFGILTFPILFGIMLLNEIRSQVALDGLWRAAYRKGDTTYTVMIIWKGIGVSGSSSSEMLLENTPRLFLRLRRDLQANLP